LVECPAFGSKKHALQFLENTIKQQMNPTQSSAPSSSGATKTDSSASLSASGPIDLFIFPEMFLQDYNAGKRLAAEAEALDGPSFQAIARIAKEYQVGIVYGYGESVVRTPETPTSLQPTKQLRAKRKHEFAFEIKDASDGSPSSSSSSSSSSGSLVYNSAMFVDKNGERLLNYRKTHLYGDYEHTYFCAGSSLSPIVEFEGM